MRLKLKRGQEEIIGFVLIIVLVSVIALVFLAINLRKPAERIQSDEVNNFLQASMRYSTDCFTSRELRQNLQEVIALCSRNQQCLDDINSCSELNRTFRKLLDESWRPSKESPVKSYSLKVYSQETNQTILSMNSGNCSGIRISGDKNIPTESIRMELEICRVQN